MTPKVEWLTISGDVEAWRSLGLVVSSDGLVPLFGTSLRIVPAGSEGITGWALSGIDRTVEPDTNGDLLRPELSIDGLATEVVPVESPLYAQHANGASGLDHVVVLTPDLERTSSAISEATGCELKRIREVGTMRQGFHRIGRGGLIVELVERPDVAPGPAGFWGLVLNVDDLDTACASLGTDLVSAPKDAVQPGRRIATVRHQVGLGLPVALMSNETR